MGHVAKIKDSRNHKVPAKRKGKIATTTKNKMERLEQKTSRTMGKNNKEQGSAVRRGRQIHFVEDERCLMLELPRKKRPKERSNICGCLWL